MNMVRASWPTKINVAPMCEASAQNVESAQGREEVARDQV